MSTPSTEHSSMAKQNVLDNDGETSNKKPETLRLVIQLWIAMIILELIHQIFSVVIGLMDPSAMRAAARQQEASADLADSVVNSVVTAATLMLALFNLIIIGVLALMIMMVNKRSKRITSAFLLLTVFSFFFIFRMLLIFISTPGTGSSVPIAFYAIDGVVQILIGVIAAMSYLLSRKSEVLEWFAPAK